MVQQQHIIRAGWSIDLAQRVVDRCFGSVGGSIRQLLLRCHGCC
jgi:hypothetical protein